MNGLSRPVGSMLAMSGAVVALIGNLLAPRFDKDTDVEVFRAVAASDRLIPSQLILILALLLTTAGIVAIASSMRGTAGNDAAWLGSASVAAGGAIAVAQIAIATYGYRQLAENFVAADDQDRAGAFWATLSVDKVTSSLFSVWTLLFLGLAPVLIGVAMAQSRAFPTWLAGLGIVGGLICLFVGVCNLVSEDQTALDLVFLVGSLLVTAWLFAAGLLLRREPVPAAT